MKKTPTSAQVKKSGAAHVNEQGLLIPDLKPTDTEVEAYEYIRQQLRDLKWIVKDPSRSPGGQVWTQNQCLAHPQMKAAFGKKRPENVVKLSEKLLWVIEAKRTRLELDLAIDEAINYYAERINDLPGQVRAVLATGVAGTEESGYLMRTKVRIDGKWRVVTINKHEATGLLSPDDVRILIETNGSDVHEFCPAPWLFIHAAERINGFLHNGGINKNDRAKTIAALLLSVIHQPPNLETALPVLIGEINTRSEAELTANGKPEFAPRQNIPSDQHNKPRKLPGRACKDDSCTSKPEHSFGHEFKHGCPWTILRSISQIWERREGDRNCPHAPACY